MDVEKHIEALQNEVNVQNQKIIDLENRVAQTTATAPQPVASAKVPDVKLGKPPTFRGDSTESYTAFLRSLLIEFNAKPAIYDPTRNQDAHVNRIAFAMSYMTEGHASQWAEARFLEYDANGKITHTWAEFRVLMDASFRSSTSQSDAQLKMNELKMGSDTADKYITKFEVLEHLTGYNDVALLEKFKQGLPVALADAIVNARPEKTLKAWKECARDLNMRWRERQAEKKQFGQTKSTPSITSFKSTSLHSETKRPAPVPSTSTHYSTSTPRDHRDSTGITFGGQGQPMDIDRATKRALGLCYKCSQKGHLAKDCPGTAYTIRSMAGTLNRQERDELITHLQTIGTNEASGSQETTEQSF